MQLEISSVHLSEAVIQGNVEFEGKRVELELCHYDDPYNGFIASAMFEDESVAQYDYIHSKWLIEHVSQTEMKKVFDAMVSILRSMQATYTNVQIS